MSDPLPSDADLRHWVACGFDEMVAPAVERGALESNPGLAAELLLLAAQRNRAEIARLLLDSVPPGTRRRPTKPRRTGPDADRSRTTPRVARILRLLEAQR